MFNKVLFHRILAWFTLFSMSLAACTAAPALTPTATMSVETPTPSVTATEVPPTATATVTPDPNMPPGESVYKKDGTYYKPSVNEFGENVTLEWVPIQFAGDAEKGIKGRWFSPHGGFPAIEKGMEGFDLAEDLIPVKFDILEGSEGPKIYSQHDASHIVRGAFGNMIYSTYNKIYYQEHFGRKQKNGEYSEFFRALRSPQGASTTIHTMDGKMHEITFSKTSGVIVRGVDIEIAKNDLRFQKRSLTFSKNSIYVFTTAENGTMVSYVASESPLETMSPKEIRQILLFSLVSFSIGNDEAEVYLRKLAGLYTSLNVWADQTGKGERPIIGVEYPPVPILITTPTTTPTKIGE